MGAGEPAAQWAAVLLFWLVWFAIAAYLVLRPEVVGQATGLLLVRYVNRPSPAWSMRLVGCGMLAYLPGRIVACLAHRSWAGLLAGLALAVVLYWAMDRWRPVHEDAVEW